MTKEYDWAKLPEGVVYSPHGEGLTAYGYVYYLRTGTLTLAAGDRTECPHDPDAAAEAYVRLRAAAKACEVTWADEWCEVTGGYAPINENGSAVGVEYDGLLVYGYCDGSRRYRICARVNPKPTLQTLKRITETVEKLEALGWRAY